MFMMNFSFHDKGKPLYSKEAAPDRVLALHVGSSGIRRPVYVHWRWLSQ